MERFRRLAAEGADLSELDLADEAPFAAVVLAGNVLPFLAAGSEPA